MASSSQGTTSKGGQPFFGQTAPEAEFESEENKFMPRQRRIEYEHAVYPPARRPGSHGGDLHLQIQTREEQIIGKTNKGQNYGLTFVSNGLSENRTIFERLVLFDAYYSQV